MGDRFHHRQNYIDGWYELDADKLHASIANDFFFDDPAVPELVMRATLTQYMHEWDRRVTDAGATGEWELSDVVNIDEGGVLLCWEWWKVLGTSFEGAAVVKTTDDGVVSERIVYRCSAVSGPT